MRPRRCRRNQGSASGYPIIAAEPVTQVGRLQCVAVSTYYQEALLMSSVLISLVLLAFIPHAILGAIGIDRLMVQIPGWYRVGPQVFATYARATDLGNGKFLYPLLGIGGPVLTLAALAAALVQHAPTQLVILLVVAVALCVLHSVTTARAAPAMLRVGRVGSDEAALSPLLDRFVGWSIPRAMLQVLTAAVLLWILCVRW